ncbi:MAG: hypothetical protein AAGF98_17350 [Cyanobacteria bacterium P01_H01_bin.153]
MTQAIVNLTLPVITHKVKEILGNTPAKSHPLSTASSALEAKLVAYVLRRMPAFYVATDQSYHDSIDNPISCFSPAQQRQMDELIDEGLQHLMARRSTWETAVQDAASGLGPSPSHWFG